VTITGMAKEVLRRLYFLSNLIGYDPVKTSVFVNGLSFYYRDLKKLKLQKGNNTDFVFGPPFPVLGERSSPSGKMSGPYFHQDLLVATRIYNNKPEKHVDIGSRIDGFVAHLAVFREIEVIDIRPQTHSVRNIVFKRANMMDLDAHLVDYCDSVSSLHAIEHFGLGRYGDPIDYYGHIKAINNIYRLLTKGGKFYLSVPIGKQRIEFNAHRVFDISYLLKLFDNKFIVDRFSYVDDAGDLFDDVKLDSNCINSNLNCSLGCGIFEMSKV
jgi:SAM-dependent methyltransferase